MGLNIFHHTLHLPSDMGKIWHGIWTQCYWALVNSTKICTGQATPFSYIYLCIGILFSVSLSFLLLHHHSSLGRGVAVSCKYCYSCMFKYQHGQVTTKVCYTNITLLSLFFLINSWNTVGEDYKFWRTMAIKPHFEEQCNPYNYTFLWAIFQEQRKWDAS